jgi:hypothetical protein
MYMWYYPILYLDTNKVKEHLVITKGMDVNGHERLPNITLRHKIK